MLSIEGWLNGIITTSLILIACSSGLYLIFKSTKLKTKPLVYLGFAILFSVLTYSYLFFYNKYSMVIYYFNIRKRNEKRKSR
jgi:hypothetical protein